MKSEVDAAELNLSKFAKEFSNEDKARKLMEAMRWPDGPVCPHCKNHKDKSIYTLAPKKESNRPGRKGLYKCGACRKQFTVTVKTIFEDSHIPISKWLMAIVIMCGAKKSISAHQLHRMLGLSYKAAWFMAHRIRFAFKDESGQPKLDGTLECDETYVGKKSDVRHSKSSKVALAALVQRNGTVRTRVFKSVTEKNMREFIGGNASKDAILNTDEHAAYRGKFRDFKGHNVVNHSKYEYARKIKGQPTAGVNNCESFFSLIKRGIVGSFHHVSVHHLHRYADEFAFRWSHRKLEDGERAAQAISLVEGKRLMYRDW